MPFKSKAQQRFMFAAEERGDVPKGIAEEWAHKTKNIKKLPEHKKKASEIAPEVLLLLGTVLGGGAYLGYKHKLQKVPKEASEIAGAVMRKVSTKGKTAALLARRVICKVATITNEDVQGALATGKPARNIEDDEINEMASEWRARGKEEAKNRPWWGAGIGGTLGGVLGALAGSSHSIRPRSGVGGLAGGLIGLGLGGAAGLGLGALSRHSHAVGNQKEARFLGDTAQSGLPYWKYGNPASDEAIRSVETQLAIAFPADYRAIVAQHNGGRPKPNAVDAPGKREVIMERLMSVDAGAKDNVAAATLVARKRHQSNLVPFASDPFGNLFCFQVAGKTPSAVVFWDHESGALTGICKTFPELLGMLHEPRR